MTIRWASGLRSGFKQGFNPLRAGTRGDWVAIALALALLPQLLSGQTTPGGAASQSGPSVSRSPSAGSAPAFTAASAPAGYVLNANDAVTVRSLAKRICAQADD